MPDQPRVLIVIKELDPGGAEVLIAELVEQPGPGPQYEVAYVRRDMDGLVPRIAASVPVHCLGAVSDGDLSWLPRLRRLIATGGFDVVHAHLASTAALCRLAVKSLPASLRPRLVYTEHSTWTELDPRTKLLSRLTFRLDDVAYAVADSNQRLLPRSLRRRTQVLHHGIDLTKFRIQADRSEVRAEFDVPPDHFVAITTANMRPQKDYPNLLRAATLLLDLPITILAAGGGPLLEDMTEAHAQLGLGSRVQLLGRRADIPRLLAAADLFVLASAWECMPVAVMEAAAAGLPIVATAVGELPAVLRDGQDALLVPPQDPAALADAIRTVVADSSRRVALTAATPAIAERFDIRRTARTLHQAYQRLAS